MKIKFLLFTVVLVLSSCVGHDEIAVFNLSNHNLVFDYVEDSNDTNRVNYIAYYLRYKKKWLNKNQRLARLDDIFVDCSFESYIKKSPRKELAFYAFNLDTMEKYKEGYKLSYLINKKLYYQKINFTIDTLDQLDWIITVK
ncbi:MAG: hypothetical protein H0W73_11565 [Bacteroidetes bacterium]|nr:hypothetical protein [Bacteroidota bacterium]